LSESDLLRIGVECYAGYRGEETPRALRLGDRRIDVVEVLDRWLAPDHRYFKVRSDDGDTYIVRQETSTDEWTWSVFLSGAGAGRGDSREE
jgi:hypothetical protein